MVKPLEAKLEPGAPEEKEAPSPGHLLRLCLFALGVVYGDIGTSPLYAVKTCFYGKDAMMPHPINVFGVLSLIFWSLIIIISIKYLIYVMKADNRGEGGILALMSLVHPKGRIKAFKRWLLVAIGLFGAALLYGDGTITPAISVLSAVEGLDVATDFFKHYIVPITILILILLFAFQRQGTKTVGVVFGPIMVAWFIALAILGVWGIIRKPEVVTAINPAHAFTFFLANGSQGFLVLGFVFLAVTGGEALYADIGHFGKTPIRLAWFCLVLPALVLNYFGQGALLLANPGAARNPFYLLAPSWAHYPLVILATVATVIASQAIISGAFSLTRQAIQLGYLPRMKIEHTSAEEIGQVYLGGVNWVLCAATIALVLGFQESRYLASAYGVAVSATMVITTILTGVVAYELWGWPKVLAVAVAVLFLIPDSTFFGANLIKIPEGGWYPILVAALAFTLMTTWYRGGILIKDKMRASRIRVEKYLRDLRREPPPRVKGTAIFLTGNTEGVPQALVYQLRHNKVLHERVIFLTIIFENLPRVRGNSQVEKRGLGQNFYRVILRSGFMETVTLPKILNRLKLVDLEIDTEETSFFLSRANIRPGKGPKMTFWRAKILSLMARNAMSATEFFQIPMDKVIELGVYVEL